MWFLCNKLNLLKDSETVTELMIKKNHSFMMAHLRDLIQTGWLEEYINIPSENFSWTLFCE